MQSYGKQARMPRSYASSKLRLTDLPTGVKCRAASVAKKLTHLAIRLASQRAAERMMEVIYVRYKYVEKHQSNQNSLNLHVLYLCQI